MSDFKIQWELKSLGPTPGTAAFSEWMKKITDQFADFTQRWKPAIDQVDQITPASLSELIGTFADGRIQFHQALSLVECYQSEEASNETYRLACGQVLALKPIVETAEHRLDQIFTRIDAHTLQSWQESPELKPLQKYIARRILEAEHRLPEQLNEFASQLNVDGLQAWSRLYDLFSGNVRVQLMEKGELVEKSPGQVACDGPERGDRENRFWASQKAWKKIADPCAAILNHLIGSRLTLDQFAGRTSFLTVPMLQNRVTLKSVEAMWAAITDFKPRLVEYMQAKQNYLGISNWSWFDLDCPICPEVVHVNYSTGCELILQSFAKFHPPLAQFSQTALTQGWIEAEDRDGKRQGGFCTDLPVSGQTRIFMTYRDVEESLGTLAHELGHAYHTWVLRNQPYVTQSYPMSLAEMASTFAETIVAEERMKSIVSEQEKLINLDRLLNDAVAYLMNIHARWLFDNELHETRKQRELSTQELTEMMLRAQKTAFLDSLDEHGYHSTFWISKLHFYIAEESFYNFPYTFGYLLSQRLYREAEQDFPNFPARYDQFLLATSGPSALTAAQDAFGYDLETVDFWKTALEPIQHRVDQFLELTAHKRKSSV